MMHDENQNSIRKLSNLRHFYVINSFIEKYYKFGSYLSGQDGLKLENERIG